MVDTATVIDPKRDNALLGDGWTWSKRHLCRVKNDKEQLRVRDGEVAFFVVKRNTHGIRAFEPYGEPDVAPVLKMVLLTREPTAITQLRRRWREYD